MTITILTETISNKGVKNEEKILSIFLCSIMVATLLTACRSAYKNPVTGEVGGKKEETETTSVEEIVETEESTIETETEEIIADTEVQAEAIETEETNVSEEASSTEARTDFAGSDVMSEPWEYLGVYIDGNYFHLQENVYSELEANLLATDWLVLENPIRTHGFYRNIETIENLGPIKDERLHTTNTDDEKFYQLWIQNPQSLELYGGLTQSSTRADVKSIWGEPNYFVTELDVRVYDYYVHPTGLYWVEILYEDVKEGMTYDDCKIKQIRFVYEKDNFLSDINRKLKDGTENQLKKCED